MTEPITDDVAMACRQQLVDDGYAVVPGVMSADLLADLCAWSDDVFDRLPVDPKFRYQGSDIHVATPRSWPAGLCWTIPGLKRRSLSGRVPASHSSLRSLSSSAT